MDAKLKQHFQQNQKVMIRRLGDDKEYRAFVVGLYSEDSVVDCYIVGLVDRLDKYNWSHKVIIESCLDAEEWKDDFHGAVKPTSEY